MTSEQHSYWTRIPTWNSKNPNFEVLSDDLSGRLPSVKVEHWRDFTDILESDFFNQKGQQFVFRGHRRHDWSLTPTLGRLSPSGIATDELALKQINLFRQTIRGRISDHSLLLEDEQLDELWSIGQHHGLHTPLLDFTYSPYVSLFFAFHEEDKEEEEDNPYRAVYVLNKSFIDRNPSVFEEVRIFEPRKDDHGRLVSQAGLFIFTPTDATLENKLANILADPEFPDDELRNAEIGDDVNIMAKYICKIYIKNEDHSNCLKHLRRMNVHHASLFPDLIGAANYCNTLTTEVERERQIAEKPKDTASSENPEQIKVEEKEPSKMDITDVSSLMELLSQPEESRVVEPGRIKVIAEELTKTLQKNKFVDWDVRESVQARIRNKARVILRKYAYPQELREEMVNKIIEFEKAEIDPKVDES